MKLPLPNNAEPVEIAGVQYQLDRIFGESLLNAINQTINSTGFQGDWFKQVNSTRQSKNLPVWDDPSDVRFLLKEASWQHSLLRKLIPGVDDSWAAEAKTLGKLLNAWAHRSINPTPGSLLDILYPMQHLAMLSNLDIAGDFQASISRLKSILDGTFKVQPSAGISDPEARKYAEDVAEKIEEIRKRPPVGSLWEGKIGTRLLRLNKAMRDLTENGVSIRSELGEDADEKITSLLRYFPLGGEVRVATDGAIMGFKKGDPYLIGWLGEEPGKSEEQMRGFYNSRHYRYNQNEIFDVQSGEKLSIAAPESTQQLMDALNKWGLPEESHLRISVYGDLVFEPEQGEPRKITIVHKGIWFPGHLPEA